ncbi:MAG: bifunctional UDP-N-acetylglucosamine diphosphorylase/glucosamine-1-phosphate N-acetyltransferase GlmU [Solirubrobacteraceae bacterium]
MGAPVVVILAAGEGTRMLSATPKLLHTICGRPMIGWPVQAAREARAAQIVVVDAPGGRLEGSVAGVEFAVQEQARGTADAVKSARRLIPPDSTVVVMNGDHPLITARTIGDLIEAHGRVRAAATVATAVLRDPSGYGRVVRAPDGTVERIVETKAPGDASDVDLQIREISTGLFAFEGEELLAALEDVRPDNAQGEMYLPDVLSILRAQGRTVAAHVISDSGELGINDRAQLAVVRAVAQRRIHERHMLAGVTIVDPSCAVIDVAVEIGQESLIAPFTSLHGRTSIGCGTTIGPHSTLIDARVGDGATIVHAYVKEATIGDRVSVGPFAYLRPGTLLREGSKAGTFVEIKNSDVGAGSKIPHLSYIGDAQIGEGTNLGASTITANYDGFEKHRTTIGSGVKTAVDTTLVAPVALGDGAFTAAGSVIGQDVPPGALGGSPGVARSQQRNVEGYAERRRGRDALAPRSDDNRDASAPRSDDDRDASGPRPG